MVIVNRHGHQEKCAMRVLACNTHRAGRKPWWAAILRAQRWSVADEQRKANSNPESFHVEPRLGGNRVVEVRTAVYTPLQTANLIPCRPGVKSKRLAGSARTRRRSLPAPVPFTSPFFFSGLPVISVLRSFFAWTPSARPRKGYSRDTSFQTPRVCIASVCS